jgi:pimeloyl-ACP methyl ester carboxylesterase
LAALSPEQRAAMAGNRAALATYAGSMVDPSLRARLAGVTRPTLVAWGESDRIFDIDYGRAYAQAIPGARFQRLAESGHLPQIETPAELAAAVWAFVNP